MYSINSTQAKRLALTIAACSVLCSILLAQNNSVAPLDILFPPAKQKSMGLYKLNASEKNELKIHVESILK